MLSECITAIRLVELAAAGKHCMGIIAIHFTFLTSVIAACLHVYVCFPHLMVQTNGTVHVLLVYLFKSVNCFFFFFYISASLSEFEAESRRLCVEIFITSAMESKSEQEPAERQLKETNHSVRRECIFFTFICSNIQRFNFN